MLRLRGLFQSVDPHVDDLVASETGRRTPLATQDSWILDVGKDPGRPAGQLLAESVFYEFYRPVGYSFCRNAGSLSSIGDDRDWHPDYEPVPDNGYTTELITTNSMSYETILYEVGQHVATITLNRPDRMNAITRQLEEELFNAMQTAEQSDDVRVIVLTGAGRGFCAGADLSNLGAATETDWSVVDQAELRQRLLPTRPREGARTDFQKTYSYFPAIGKPILGAINGAAVGLGFVLQLYCDIRIASDEARFGTAFAQRGLIAEHGVSWMLPRLIGISNALDLLYSARLINAQEAQQMGLVSRVVPHGELLDEARRYATLLATTVSPRSLRIMKKQVYDALFSDLDEAIETANDEMLLSFQCADFKEGVAHFVDKRPPRFTGA